MRGVPPKIFMIGLDRTPVRFRFGRRTFDLSQMRASKTNLYMGSILGWLKANRAIPDAGLGRGIVSPDWAARHRTSVPRRGAVAGAPMNPHRECIMIMHRDNAS